MQPTNSVKALKDVHCSDQAPISSLSTKTHTDQPKHSKVNPVTWSQVW